MGSRAPSGMVSLDATPITTPVRTPNRSPSPMARSPRDSTERTTLGKSAIRLELLIIFRDFLNAVQDGQIDGTLTAKNSVWPCIIRWIVVYSIWYGHGTVII